MNKIFKKLTAGLMVAGMMLNFTGCGGAEDNSVTIYSSAEDYRNEYYLSRLQEQFPDYDITIEYMETGNHAAKLLAEGTDTECDITLSVEYGYMQKYSEYLAAMTEYGYEQFMDDTVDPNHKIFPEMRNGCAIILNMDMLAAKNLPEPTSYEDLLKPEYKGLISMPNPKSSGTGYSFLKALVNSMGEDEAFAYFDKLSENILQYTSSGSGPVNNLVSGEAVIGLGITAHAVTQMNNGANLKIVFFEEGSPYSAYGYGIIKGKEARQCVKDVFDFLYNTLIYENCEKFYPEQIYKDVTFEIANYPTNITYADMSNNTQEEKERLLSKWMY